MSEVIGQFYMPDQIIAANYHHMITCGFQTDMYESVGGNAQSVEINGTVWDNAAYRGFADRDTGRIALFGVTQMVSEDIKAQNGEFIYLVSAVPRKVDYANKYPGARIVKLLNAHGRAFTATDDFSPMALWRLKESGMYYNDRETQMTGLTWAQMLQVTPKSS